MADNEVNLTFTGDHDDLEQSFDRMGSAADEMSGEVNRSAGKMGSAAESFDRVGDAADDVDTKAMGFRDTLTGVADTAKGTSLIMEGDLMTGFLTLGAGVGDLASGIANLGAPLLKTVSTWVTGHATMAASSIATAASHVASWFAMAAASLAGAAQVALSWLIAMGPIILVIAAVVALVVVIVKNWDTIKRVIAAGWAFVKRITVTVWNAIKAVVRTVFNGIKTIITTQIAVITNGFRRFKSTVTAIFRGIGRAMTAPIRSALNAIRNIWNSTIGGKGISIPGFLGFGGISFTIPRLAKGATVTGPTVALLGEGETPEQVTPLSPFDGGGRGGGLTVIRIDSGGSRMDDLLVEVLRESIDEGGGNVQVHLGVSS